MMEWIYDRIWRVGLWLRNRAKTASWLGPIEPVLLKLAPRLIPAPRTEILINLPSGMRMKMPPGYPAARSYSSGSYEPEVTRLFRSIVVHGMTVVDAGANVGYYTLLAAGRMAATGRVYAFEPDPVNYSYLTQNIEANDCAGVRTVRKALSNTSSTGKFIQDPHGAEGFLTQSLDNPGALDVTTVRLDDFFAAEGWPIVHLMKIDVEGSEKAALQGMRELSQRNPDLQLIMELNAPAISRSGGTVGEVAELLRDLGFTRGYVIEAGRRPFSIVTEFPRTTATYNLLLLKKRNTTHET